MKKVHDASGGRIFRYVVRLDQGGSPNPYHGWCSLAVCKPQVRRTARAGDWIIGLRSRANDQVVCAMRVDEVLPLGDYWRDPRFRAKRPGGVGPPDNFYQAGADGSLRRIDNALHGPDLAAQDIGGRHALVSWHFWYFGDQSPEWPTALVHLVHSGQGHSLHANRRANDLRTLVAWLAHWPTGVHGRPIDARRFQAPTDHRQVVLGNESINGGTPDPSARRSPRLAAPHSLQPQPNPPS